MAKLDNNRRGTQTWVQAVITRVLFGESWVPWVRLVAPVAIVSLIAVFMFDASTWWALAPIVASAVGGGAWRSRRRRTPPRR